MRLIFLSLGYSPDAIGGACRYVRELAKTLAARGRSVAAVFPSCRGSFATGEVFEGVHLFPYRNRRGFFWANWAAENQEARRGIARAEAALANAAGAGPVRRVVCHGYFAPNARSGSSLFLFTGPWAEEHRWARQAAEPGRSRALDPLIFRAMHFAEGRALRRSALICTISQYYADSLPQWHGARLPPIRLISAGVDAARFSPAADRALLRQSFGAAPGDFVIGAARRLEARMGLDLLAPAFAQCAAEQPHARLWIAGEGPMRAALEEQANRLGVRAQIRFWGRVSEEELPRFYAAADCTVLPSLALEGFGLAALESLACGTPALGARSGALPEVLAPLSPELLFEPGSPESLAAKIASVLRDPRILPNALQCRQYAAQRFSWEKTAAAFEQSAGELSPAAHGA